MKKKGWIRIMALSFCFSVLFSACGQKEEHSSGGAEGDGSGSSAQYRIELNGNATTGYSWVYTADPEGIVKEVSSEYLPEEEGKTGAPGVFVFVFEGVKEGETTLNFSYVRSWEEEEDPDTADFLLAVDAEGNITEIEKNLPEQQ